MFLHILFLTLIYVNATIGRNLSQNVTSILTTYSKVANFGSKTPTVNEGRSSGMSLYTQSSNAKIISGQNLNSRMYYSAKPSKMGQRVSEILPAKGEVQERFNPRPYFDYMHYVHPKKHETSSGSSKPSPVYGAPFDSFPVFKGSDQSNGDAKPVAYLPPREDPKPSHMNSGMDSYSSMFNSYNPPMGVNEDKDVQGPVYPPNDSYGPPMKENNGMDSYQPTNSKEENSKPMSNSAYPGYPYAPSNDMPPEDAMSSGKETSSEDSNAESEMGPTIVNTVKPPGPVEMPYQDYPPSKYHYHHEEPPMEDSSSMNNSPMEDSSSMDNSQDMDMPANNVPNGYPKLPEYLDHDPKEHGYHYPEYYHYEPVYKEITTTTTTTTEAPQERVNNNYSYYYLGRKLWYIPLYFSAYFIIYITVLILKSIARHKVNFWHDLHNLGDNRRQGRNLEFDELTKNVTGSIENARAKYMM